MIGALERLVTPMDLVSPPSRPLCQQCGVRGCLARHRAVRATWWRRRR